VGPTNCGAHFVQDQRGMALRSKTREERCWPAHTGPCSHRTQFHNPRHAALVTSPAHASRSLSFSPRWRLSHITRPNQLPRHSRQPWPRRHLQRDSPRLTQQSRTEGPRDKLVTQGCEGSSPHARAHSLTELLVRRGCSWSGPSVPQPVSVSSGCESALPSARPEIDGPSPVAAVEHTLSCDTPLFPGQSGILGENRRYVADHARDGARPRSLRLDKVYRTGIGSINALEERGAFACRPSARRQPIRDPSSPRSM
jgi:hypothetical protein